ncbi:hypothetical protein BpHYR1_028777 [Brachionus plicatilis]|uniref:Uncharacterized protein n=1 Tax=Brachionus plicatilis TaxID=10195 RepID=A0A3M7RSJ2_BRAPC|nr:hypothetical protein BpHYR1_028777 [Brachionus plicatilis]
MPLVMAPKIPPVLLISCVSIQQLIPLSSKNFTKLLGSSHPRLVGVVREPFLAASCDKFLTRDKTSRHFWSLANSSEIPNITSLDSLRAYVMVSNFSVLGL